MEYLNELFDNANMRRLDAQEIRDCGINESTSEDELYDIFVAYRSESQQQPKYITEQNQL